MTKPDWKRKIESYKTVAVEASQRRIDDRVQVLEIIRGKGSMADKVDRIIDYFRQKYEGTRYRGFPLKDRLEIFHKYEGKCMWCGNRIVFKDMTIEHIVPISEGGENIMDNLGCSCAVCNGSREGDILTKNGYLKK